MCTKDYITVYQSSCRFYQGWSTPRKMRFSKIISGHLRKNNIQIIFISNRMHERLDATIENLKNLNIYHEDDIFLLNKVT